MPRLYLKLIFPIVVVGLMLVIVARTLGSTLEANPALRGFTEGCEGKTYITSVVADAAGNWQYGGGLLNDHIVATATDDLGATSEYSRPEVNTTNVQVQPTGCGLSNGAVCGIKIVSGTVFQ